MKPHISTPNAQQIRSITLAQLRAQISDDAFAATFQTMGQYRTALLKTMADHFGDATDMVEKQRHGSPCSLERATAIVRWVAHLFSTIAAIDACQGSPVNLSFERNNFNRALAKLHEASALLSASSSEPRVEPRTIARQGTDSPAQHLM